MARWMLRLGLALGAAGWLAGGAASAQDARYFQGTRSSANVYVAPVASSIQKVAVMPFKAPTELIGSSVSDIFVTEMLRARRYTLVERGQIAQVLGETEFALAGLTDSAAIAAGRMLGADGVILGTVDEYGTVAHRGRSYPVVGASIRLIDCDSGQVMWSVGHARRADSPVDTLSGHARKVVHEMVAAVVQNWRVQRVVASDRRSSSVPRDNPDDPVGFSGPVVMTEAMPPPQPEGLTTDDFGLRAVTLRWPPPADRSLSYRVERAEGPDGPFAPLATVAATRGAYTDAGSRGVPLSDATAYYYRLVALDRMRAESDPSAVAESLTAPPPDPPENVATEAPAGRMARLTWDPAAAEGVTSYIVERADAKDGDFIRAGTVAAARFEEGGTTSSPLADSTPYWYRVRSVNRVGSAGEPSAPVRLTTRPPPAPPAGLRATSREVRCVPLEWPPHPDNDIARYDIYRADSPDGPFARLTSVHGRDTTSWLDGGRDPGNLGDARKYVYFIRAINTVGSESGDSKTVAAATRPLPPSVAGLAAATGLPRRVELTWTPSPDDKVVAYEIERAEAGEPFAAIARLEDRERSAYEDTGGTARRPAPRPSLRDGTPYAYRIRALNTASAASDWCKPATAVTKVVPRAPAGLRTSSGKARVIGLVWQANPEADIAHYIVQMSVAPDRGFVEAGRVEADALRGLKQDGLPPGLTRYYRIKAVDADGLESEWSAVLAGATKPQPAPPARLAVEWTGDSARLTWEPPPQSDIAAYRIFSKRLMGQDEIATVKKAEYVFPADALAKKLVILVVAIDRDDLESAPSAPLERRQPTEGAQGSAPHGGGWGAGV